MSVQDFFKTMDANDDGEISREEFQSFWIAIKQSGHTEEMIKTELEKV